MQWEPWQQMQHANMTLNKSCFSGRQCWQHQQRSWWGVDCWLLREEREKCVGWFACLYTHTVSSVICTHRLCLLGWSILFLELKIKTVTLFTNRYQPNLSIVWCPAHCTLHNAHCTWSFYTSSGPSELCLMAFMSQLDRQDGPNIS